jgi:predicted nuclease with TOPRIM domain
MTQKERAEELVALLRENRELAEANERMEREVERAAREIDNWRNEASAMPGSILGELLLAKNVEIAALKSRVRELQAQHDEQASYRVFLVPGSQHLDACKAALAADPKLETGDRLRDADSLREFAWNGRNWTAV